MRVLVITPVLPDPDATSGGARVMRGQLEATAGRNEVTLATLAWGDPTDERVIADLLASGIETHPVHRQWCMRWRLAPAWLRSGQPFRVLQFSAASMQRVIDRLLAEERHDIIQVEDSAMAAYQYRTATPMLLTDHDVRRVERRARSWNGMVEQRRWERYQTRVWRRFDRLQVFTARDAAAMQVIAPEVAHRVRINPFGVTVPARPANVIVRPASVVFVGAFMHPANVDAALWLGRSIMPRLRRQVPGVRLTIVGSFPPACVRNLACGDISVVGTAPSVTQFVQEAAVVLAPVRSGGGMRVKVLEAMALGKAVVATPLGVEGLAVTGTSIPALLAGDAEGLARSTATLLHNEPARLALGEQARAFAMTYHGWPRYADRLNATYAELTAPRVAR